MGVSLTQSLAALIVICAIIYFVFMRHHDGFQNEAVPMASQYQMYVDQEFTKYYRPIESGYLFILKVLAKDSEFWGPLYKIVFACPQQQPEGVSLYTPAEFKIGGNPGGWFYESGAAITMTNAETIPALDSDEVPQNDPCAKNPDFIKGMAEWWWAQKAWVAAGRIQSGMIFFFTNSKRFGQTNSPRALPKLGAYAYIYTLNQMIFMGNYLISKLSNLGANINVEDIKKQLKDVEFKEGFGDSSCCDEPTEADMAAFQTRTTELDKYADYIANLIKKWKDVEKRLREIFNKLQNGFTQENIKQFGLEGPIKDLMKE